MDNPVHWDPYLRTRMHECAHVFGNHATKDIAPFVLSLRHSMPCQRVRACNTPTMVKTAKQTEACFGMFSPPLQRLAFRYQCRRIDIHRRLLATCLVSVSCFSQLSCSVHAHQHTRHGPTCRLCLRRCSTSRAELSAAPYPVPWAGVCIRFFSSATITLIGAYMTSCAMLRMLEPWSLRLPRKYLR